MGRDVEQIIRDLLEIAIAIEKERMRKEVYVQKLNKLQKKEFLMLLLEIKLVLLLEKVLEKD